MAKTGINFERCNVGAVELHNDRAPEYLESVKRSGRELYIFQDRQHLNRSWVNQQYEGTCAEIFENQKIRYKEVIGQEPNLEDRTRTDKKTGKQITVSGWSPIREGVCPIKEDTKLDDFKPFMEWCDANGLTVIRIDLHFDEGYENEKDGRKYNRHAHIVVDWMNWKTAKTAKLGKDKMSEVQDVIAKALGMERGEKKEETGRKHLTPAAFKEEQAIKHTIEAEAENQKLRAENLKLRNENTDLLAQINDRLKYRKRAKEAEANLEAAKNSYIKDLAELSHKIEVLSEVAENAKKQAAEAEGWEEYYREKYKTSEDEIKRLKGALQHWKDKATIGQEQDQTRTIKR